MKLEKATVFTLGAVALEMNADIVTAENAAKFLKRYWAISPWLVLAWRIHSAKRNLEKDQAKS